MINIEEIAEYFNEIFRLYGQKIMVENVELVIFFKNRKFWDSLYDTF